MERKRNKKASAERVLQLVTNSKSFQYVEAYKSLRTNLKFMEMGKEYRRIVVTSALQGEGKSNVAINLAVSLSETGASVLLIDCDLRKPTIHKYMKIETSNKGLTSVLSGAGTLKDAIVRFQNIGIDVLPSGPVPPNPAEILGSGAMSDLLDKLSGVYQYIILDTPPVSVVTDAAVLGRFADGALLVIRQKYATIDLIKQAQSKLTTVGVNIIGAILSEFDIKDTNKNADYYYYYGYSYSYSYSNSNSND